MSIECDKCQHENPDDSRFCSRCGEKLPLDAVPQTMDENDVNEQTQKFVTQFTDRIKLVATQAKYDELEDFHDQATNWVNNQFRVAKIVVTALLAFLGWLGYSGWDLNNQFKQDLAAGREEIAQFKTEYQAEIEKNQQQIESAKKDYLEQFEQNKKIVEDSQSKLKETSQEVSDKADEALDQIIAKQEEFKKIDFSQVEIYRSELEEKIKGVDQLKSDLDKQLVNLGKERARLDKIERSRFQILFHYDRYELENFQPLKFDEIQTALGDKGYYLDLDDIMNVSADRQEIVYYSATKDMANKAEEIAELIKSEINGKKIASRLERSSGADPFQILIKLCPQDVDNHFNCQK